MAIKKGDLVEIVRAYEAKDYKGRIFTVTSDPYTICGFEVVKMECQEIGKRFGGGFPTEFLRVVKKMSTEKWGVYDALEGDVSFYETEAEALDAAYIAIEPDDAIPDKHINGGVKVFKVIHESAAIDTRTREEEEERNGYASGDFDYYCDIGMVEVGEKEPYKYPPAKP